MKKVNIDVNVITDYVHPPIPVRQYDWQAWVDGDEEGPKGWGVTEQEAINNLKRELEA